MISSVTWRCIAWAVSTSTSTCFLRPVWKNYFRMVVCFPFEQLTLNRCLRRDYGMDWEPGNYGFGAIARPIRFFSTR